MKKNYVYLACPMEDVSFDHMTGWRESATKFLENAGIEVLDPTRRVQFHDDMAILGDRDPLSQSMSRRIFKMDLQDIANSTVILADARQSSGKGTGTSMELMFGHTKHKTMILWADQDDRIHPFYEALYTEKHHNLEDCLDAITYYYGD